MQFSKGFKYFLVSSVFAAGGIAGFDLAQKAYHPIIDKYKTSLEFAVKSHVRTSTTYQRKLKECRRDLEDIQEVYK